LDTCVHCVVPDMWESNTVGAGLQWLPAQGAMVRAPGARTCKQRGKPLSDPLKHTISFNHGERLENVVTCECFGLQRQVTERALEVCHSDECAGTSEELKWSTREGELTGGFGNYVMLLCSNWLLLMKIKKVPLSTYFFLICFKIIKAQTVQ
jgi:hypothetical protein